MFTDSRQESLEPKVRDEISILLGGKKVFFKLVWMNSTYLCNSLFSFLFMKRWCLMVCLNCLWQKPVLIIHLSRNRHWGSLLSKALSHCTQNKIRTVTVNLTQCDCMYPCPFHTIFFIPWAAELQANVNYSRRNVVFNVFWSSSIKLCICCRVSILDFSCRLSGVYFCHGLYRKISVQTAGGVNRPPSKKSRVY